MASQAQQRPERTNRGGNDDDQLPVEVRSLIYSFAIDHLALRNEALVDLRRRGLPDDLAASVGYRSIPRKGTEHAAFLAALRREFADPLLARCPGFRDKNQRLTFWSAVGDRDGYIVPYRDELGRVTGIQMKVLGGKYLTAVGTRIKHVYHIAGEPGERRDLLTTEGGLKAQVAAFHGKAWCLGIPGQALQPEHIDVISCLQPARVIVALDQEVNPSTDAARERWCEALWKAGLPTYRATWEGEL
ncbi:MAG: hypothetical protein M0R74_10010 [Dehalococcoidia bacterium]|nr:hypothetical protein [Dehalococcoidia bacterium]